MVHHIRAGTYKGWIRGLPRPGVGMIDAMTTPNTAPPPGSAAPDPATAAAQAARQVHAAQQIRHAAGRWLTS